MQIALLLIFFSYFLTGFQFFAIAGYGITALDASLLLFFLILLKQIIWEGEELKFSITPPLVFLVLIFLAVLLSGISPVLEGRNDWVLQYFKSSFHFYYLAGFALICSIYPIKLEVWSNVIKLWVILALIINVFGIYQILARAYDLPLAWIDFNNVSLLRGAETAGAESEIKQLSIHYGNFYRATSIFSEPSALGAFNSFIFSFLLIPIVFKFKHFVENNTVIMLTIFFCAAGTLFTFSLTAILGLVLIVGFLLMFLKIKNIKRFAFISISLFVVILAADGIFSDNLGVSVIELFTKRLEGIFAFGQSDKMVFGESFGVRLLSAGKAIAIWEHYPITGIGLGLTDYNLINNLEFSDFTVFGVMAELGMIGLIVFLGFFISLFIITYRFLKDPFYKNHFTAFELRLMNILFFMMLVLFMINFISGNVFILINLWGPVALIMSIINNVYVKLNRKVYYLKLVKTPLKTVFARYLGSEKL